MATLLVDFENVNHFGLKGIDLVNSTDTLIIFYSKSCSNIKKEYMDDIERSGCSFKLIKLLNKGNDNLDRYLCVMVGEIHASGEQQIAIIAKDKGYQAVIDFYKVLDADDLRIVKAENIEQALISFSDPCNRERRLIITERLKLVNLDEMSARLKERESVQEKIKTALINTPYWFRTKDVCELLVEKEETGRKYIYTGAMHTFGREEGRAIYNIIKDVV